MNELIAQLAQLGIKHNSEKIVRIAKQPDGKIVFLEEGKAGKKGNGLAHIIERHRDDFARRGISEDEIADAVIAAVTRGTFLGYQGTVEPRRKIYEVSLKGELQYIAVTVGDNGYIVGANPASLP
ncbi:hypothetical protein NIES4103_39780 [Nostoc sp. NIES-4103]|nr:hypothetical protein NIES4103_39780 [Nostoc sp. NIES-4103]